MFLSRISGAAGPSRRIIASRFQCARFAPSPSPSSRPSLTRPLSISHAVLPRLAVTRLGLAPTFGARHASTLRLGDRREPLPKRHLSGEQWPWTVVANPPAGMDEIERVIYARHFTSLGKMFWAYVIVFVGGITTYLLIPSANTAIEKGIKPADEDRTVMGMPMGMFFTYVTGGWVMICAAAAIGGVFTMSRMISRLTLVQQKPSGASASKARQFLRVSTAVQQTLPFWNKPRELPVKAVTVQLLYGRMNRRSEREMNTWVKVVINDPSESAAMKLWDKVEYRLDFSNTNIGDGELVLSIPRLDSMFGPLTYSTPRGR